MAQTIEQAAILLLGMGEEQAANVMRYMEQDQVEKIVVAMNSLKDVNRDEVNKAMNEFLTESSSHTGMGGNNGDYIRNTLINALGREKADSVLDKTIISESQGLNVLKWQSPSTIFDLIHNEHPQLIGVIMTLLGGDKAAKVMGQFSEEKRLDVVNRIATLGPLSPIALDTINEVLVEMTSKLKNFKELPLGGARKIADIVSYLDSESEEKIMETLGAIDEALSEQVQDFMFPFERITELAERDIQLLLREVETEVLTVAVKAADEQTREIFFKNMSSRAADMIKDDLEAMGPTPLSKVIEAQKAIVAIAQRMGDEDKIALGGVGSEKMV